MKSDDSQFDTSFYTIEELRRSNPTLFRRRHRDEGFDSDSSENIAQEEALGLFRGVTVLRLWYDKKWYSCTFVRRTYERITKFMTNRWGAMREPYLYRFHWHLDPPKTYTNGPLCQIRAWNPHRVRKDGTFIPLAEMKEKKEEEGEKDNNKKEEDTWG